MFNPLRQHQPSLRSAKTVVLELVKIKSDWRIADIVWRHDGTRDTLRGLFK